MMWLGFALVAGGLAEGHAEDAVRPVASPAVKPVAPPVLAPETSPPVAAVGGSTTNRPSSTTVPLGDPVMVQPAVEVLGEMASRDRSDLINRGTQ